ncbi:MAG: PaaI family thioesterase, partial [Anaerolineales bacterium]
NFLSPAVGKGFRAEGRVVKSGKTISVCEGKLFAIQDEGEKLVAMMQATMICIPTAIERGVHDKGEI